MTSVPRLSLFRLSPDAPQWQHLLRATLQECAYLPDPIARSYMRSYVLDRYRRAANSKLTEAKLTQAAKKGLRLLQRANEGYPRPLDKVLFMSYGRIGKRRHELLNQLLYPEVPNPADPNALPEVTKTVSDFEDGWEAPETISSLIRSQMNHGVFTASRLRAQIKSAEPVIPKENSWGRPISPARRTNIRRQWYLNSLDSLLPPLPEHELFILNGLIDGSLPWKSPRKRPEQPQASEGNSVLEFLTEGPQKSNTFRPYVNGRPHQITNRLMQRQWRRISAFVPRMEWNDISKKWAFSWDAPKNFPSIAFDVDQNSELDEIFGGLSENQAPSAPKPKARAKSNKSEK